MSAVIFSLFLLCIPLTHLFSFDDGDSLWMDQQVEREFRNFKDGITWEMIETAKNQEPLYKEYFHLYKIIDSTVSGPNTSIRALLNKLVELYPIPNLVFAYWHADGIILLDGMDHPHIAPGPIFVSAKHKNCNHAILFWPWNFEINSSDPSNWPHLFQTVSSLVDDTAWADKKPVAFWRGSSNGPYDYSFEGWKETPRGKVCYLSHLHPDLITAGFGWYFSDIYVQIRDLENIDIGLRKFEISETLQFKYQLSIDGHTCAYPAILWKLLSKCLVFMQDSEHIMWYHSQLHPWEHYVPLRSDLSDLLEKLEWARENDALCSEIAAKAHHFAKRQLNIDAIMLYCYKVLKKYASLQKFDPSEVARTCSSS